ncbi:type I-B CRISPR-associated protein Cas5b [Caryophanon tenue]|uniref:Type I-B CRISPR-associated protein Cas5 n=1 Tax=Caryophanon tenue TaxID=33978 RepID=A0A1C0YCA0_9BACL|nr:type I-B CRISPR-associated protein Cas5b [Caryophanon tenue]OCS84759.1 type I-B CRISPR-associated protein Cas5 [Caryophanon tenue]
MKLLRLKIFQETACYLKPFAFKVGETFPLAPFSTVKGMLHAVLDAKEYIPMNISIQGQSESFVIDYQKKYMYKKLEVPPIVTTAGLREEPEPDTSVYSTMPMYQHLLFNVEHVIHVEAEEAILNALYEKLHHLNTTLSLGRWEDLVRIDEVTFVEASEQIFEATVYNQYVPVEHEDVLFVTGHLAYYRLPRKYTIVNGRREWDYTVVIYALKDTLISEDTCVLTDGSYSIFLMKG